MLSRIRALFAGPRPDLTHAQAGGLLIAGVPIIANILHAFGVYSATPEQQDALSQALRWGTIIGSVLIGGDAALRGSRNQADAKVKAAAHLAAASQAQQGALGAVAAPLDEAKAAAQGDTLPGTGGGSTEAEAPPTAEEIAAALADHPSLADSSLTPTDPEVEEEEAAGATVSDAAELASPPPKD